MYNIETQGKWELGVSEGVEVKHIQWKEENYVKYMSKVDIGLNPNNTIMTKEIVEKRYDYFKTFQL